MSPSTLNGAVSHEPLVGSAIPEILWPPAPQSLKLEAGQVHLFCASPAEFKSHRTRLERLLSPSEIERAGRFQFAKNRAYFAVRHALLRLLLSRYLDKAPAEIEFESGEFGKPELKASPLPSLHFNLSDSSDLVLFGVTGAGPIGVDVEAVQPIPEFENIATQYFCPPEVERMRALPEEHRMKAFYSCWTAKEAYLKATGQGIASGLNQVEVALDSSLRAQALHFPEDGAEHAWELRSFSPASGYVGAMAMQLSITSLRAWRLPESFAAAR